MDDIMREKLLSRSKSTGFLNKLDNNFDYKCFSARFCGYNGCDDAHASVSTIGACYACDDSDVSAEDTKLDSGIKSTVDDTSLFMLEQKVDKLNELLQEQHNLLMSIKNKVISSKPVSEEQHGTGEVITKKEGCENNEETKLSNETMKLDATCNSGIEDDGASAAQGLSHAIDVSQDGRSTVLDHMIRAALENFLQSDDLREHVVTVTAECVKGVVRGSFFYRVISNAYLPMVERSHRRLVKHVTRLLEDSFTELEEGTASLFKTINKTSRNIRASLERHQNLLETLHPFKDVRTLRTILKGVLEEELKTWRAKIVQEITSEIQRDCSCTSTSPDPPFVEYAPPSPKQPANPDMSVIDTLMKCAIINKYVKDGDLNKAFEEALSSSDLSLVMAACRAVDPARCALRPPVLLSLVQQLATDMVHDTQLKCRYLEEAIINLDKCDAATRDHLALVVGEVRKHLTKFLLAYPKHHANRRVALIVMAAENLLQ